ncbi:MAG: hypothetical protein ABGX16_01140 [Pirellulales bacterium]
MRFNLNRKVVALVATGCLMAAIAAPAEAVSVSIPVGLTMPNFSDDAEEQTVVSDSLSKVPGWVGTNSSDIEMGQEDAGGAANGCMDGVPCEAANPMIAGFRFLNIPVPQGATITGASIQFTSDEPDKNSFPANFRITGELQPDTATFVQPNSTVANFNISSRNRTVGTVAWNPDPWVAAGLSGPAQLTSDIASLVQEIVDQPLWLSGNSMVFIVEGSRYDGFEGNRTTNSQRDNAADPVAVLNLEYVPEPSALVLSLMAMVALVSRSRSKVRGV